MNDTQIFRLKEALRDALAQWAWYYQDKYGEPITGENSKSEGSEYRAAFRALEAGK